MLNQQTIEKLHVMRMRGMADALTRQQEDPQTTQLSFEERFALLVDRQWNWRQNRALERRLRRIFPRRAGEIWPVSVWTDKSYWFSAAAGFCLHPYFLGRLTPSAARISSWRASGFGRRVSLVLSSI